MWANSKISVAQNAIDAYGSEAKSMIPISGMMRAAKMRHMMRFMRLVIASFHFCQVCLSA